MYYENYEEYMRGNNNCPNMPNPYYNYTYPNQFGCMNGFSSPQSANQLYPELYNEINRKIHNKCTAQDCRLTEENVNRITDEVYEDYKDKSVETSKMNTDKTCTNNLIKDFIKILVIKHLLSMQRNNPNRFSMPQQGMPNMYYPF